MYCRCGADLEKISFSHVSCGIEFWNCYCENCGHKVCGWIKMKIEDDYLNDLVADSEEEEKC